VRIDIAVVALLLLASGPAEGAAPARVRLEVEARAWQGKLRLFAESRWLGEERRVLLQDHGELPGDVAGDGVWVGVLEGAPVQALPVRLLLQEPGGDEQLVYAGTELIQGADDQLGFELVEGDAGPEAFRVARPLTGPVAPARSETGRLVAAGVWVLLLLNYAAWLWRSRRRTPT